MAYATLKRDIIAHEDGDDSTTKMFPAGTLLDVEDWDENWFMFSSTDDPDWLYECDDEATSNVLTFDDSELNDQDSPDTLTPVKAYVPTPNMTRLERKYLLL